MKRGLLTAASTGLVVLGGLYLWSSTSGSAFAAAPTATVVVNDPTLDIGDTR